MDLNDPRVMSLYDVSAAVSRREAALRAAGQPLHAHALSYMLSSLSARDAPGDWSVLEALARECEAATPGALFTARVGDAFDLFNEDGTYCTRVVALEPTPAPVGPDFVLIVGNADVNFTAGVPVSRLRRRD